MSDELKQLIQHYGWLVAREIAKGEKATHQSAKDVTDTESEIEKQLDGLHAELTSKKIIIDVRQEQINRLAENNLKQIDELAAERSHVDALLAQVQAANAELAQAREALAKEAWIPCEQNPEDGDYLLFTLEDAPNSEATAFEVSTYSGEYGWDTYGIPVAYRLLSAPTKRGVNV